MHRSYQKRAKENRAMHLQPEPDPAWRAHPGSITNSLALEITGQHSLEYSYFLRRSRWQKVHMGGETQQCYFMLELLTTTKHTHTLEIGLKFLTRSNTQTYTHLDRGRNNTADIPSHDMVPIQSNHRKYSQDKSSQHNNKTLALWVMMLA